MPALTVNSVEVDSQRVDMILKTLSRLLKAIGFVGNDEKSAHYFLNALFHHTKVLDLLPNATQTRKRS